MKPMRTRYCVTEGAEHLKNRGEELDGFAIRFHHDSDGYAVGVPPPGTRATKALRFPAPDLEGYHLNDPRQTFDELQELVLRRVVLRNPRVFDYQLFPSLGVLNLPARCGPSTYGVSWSRHLLKDGVLLQFSRRPSGGHRSLLLPPVGDGPLDAVVEAERALVC